MKTFILKQVEVLWSKRYGSIWVTFRVNERVNRTEALPRPDVPFTM